MTLSRRDGDLGARQVDEQVEGEVEARLPAVRRGMGGGLEHVGHIRPEAGGVEGAANPVADAVTRREADQRDLGLVAQQFDREGRRRQRVGGLHRHVLGDAARIDDLAQDFHGAKPAGLVGGEPGQRDGQPVGLDAGPVLSGGLQGRHRLAFGAALEIPGGDTGERPGTEGRAAQTDEGE